MHDDNFMQRPDDHEASMARADLYKLANYSMKLFKLIRDGQELDGWVQAKITKSADYIASVYHYMEYEMKASEYGENLEMSDVYSESLRRVFGQKLLEAKKSAAKIKAKAEKDEKIDEVFDGDKETGTTHKGGKVTKTAQGIKHQAGPKTYGGYDAKSKPDDEDEEHKPGKGNRTKGPGSKKIKEANLSVPMDGATAPPKKDPKTGQYPIITAGPNKGKRWSPQAPGPTNPAVKEAAKPDYLDMDKDGDKKEPMKKALKDKKVKEASHQEKTTMKHVKNPTAGEKKAAKDIKPGVKGYSDRVAMLKSAEKDGRLKEASKPDFLDMDKDGDKKEPMKKAVADKKKNPFTKK